MSVEQLRRLFPYLRETKQMEEFKEFRERNKKLIEFDKNMYVLFNSIRFYSFDFVNIEYNSLIFRVKLKNPGLSISISRTLTPEVVCLLQAAEMGDALLYQSGVKGTKSLSAQQSTSRSLLNCALRMHL